MIDLENKMDALLDEIREMIREKRYADLRDMFLPMESADIAQILEEAGPEVMPLLYRLLPKETAAEVFVELESESQEMLINGFSNTELKEVLDELYLDDAVDIVEEMPASVVIRILDKATPEMRKSINEILKYPEDSAGSIMNMEFLSLKKDMTVADAFKRIRRIGGELETINILYVTDPTRRLLGVLSVRDLLLADEDDLIEDIMDPDVVWAKTTDDKEDVAQALSKYDFLAMPIVDLEKRLVGIVTVDDAMDVIEEETTEDFEDGRYAALRQALSPRRRVRHMEGPYAVAADPDAVGHLYRHDFEPLRKRAGGLSGAERLYPHAVGHRRQLRYAGVGGGDPRPESGRGGLL